MNEERKDKICSVCGDKALGYNFNAITCESCKAFFRRNALKNKEFKCFFNEKCVVDIVTRRFCQKCRLRKCFQIGMKKEWIMSEEEKKAKRAKIEQNRQKRKLGIPYKIASNQTKIAMPLGTLSFGVQNSTFYNENAFGYANGKQNLNPRVTFASPKYPYTNCKNNTEYNSKLISEANHPFVLNLVHKVTDSEYKPPLVTFPKTPSEMPTGYKMISHDAHKVPTPSNSSVTFSFKHENNLDLLKKTNENSDSSSKCELGTPSEPSNKLPKDSKQGDNLTPDIHQNPALETINKVQTFDSLSNQILMNASLKSHNELASSSSMTKPCSDGNYLVHRLLFETNDIPLPPPVPNIQIGPFAQTSDNSLRFISDVERIKLNELVVANEIMKQPLTCGLPDPSLTDVLNMTNHAIRRLIKMSKKISSFRSLCQEDQIALLKGGCCELLILRSVMSYEPDKECWNGPEGPKIMSIKVDVLKKAGGKVYEQHKKFLMGFDPKWKKDENIMLLLGAITLFTPDRPNVIHKQVIKIEQDVYSYLLQRYLHTIYPTIEAISVYRLLCQKLEQLHSLNENHIQMFMETNPKDIEPLLIEIFDLNKFIFCK